MNSRCFDLGGSPNVEDEDREDTDLRSGQVHRFFRVMQFVKILFSGFNISF